MLLPPALPVKRRATRLRKRLRLRGGYGFIRVLLPMFAEATIFYLPFVDTFCLISIVYASLTTIRQIDMKRIIAYSSVAHMNLVVLGIFSGNIQGIAGSIFLMIAH